MNTLIETSPTQRDFLVIYSNKDAQSAANNSYTGISPFAGRGAAASCNRSYAYLLKYAKRLGLSAGFATVADISGTGTVSSYWTYTTQWNRVTHSATTAVVFDKFSNIAHTNDAAMKQLLGDSQSIALYHNHDTRMLFDNKLTTYAALSQYMLPTVAINLGSLKTMNTAKRALKKQIDTHAHIEDFTKELILKDVFGGGGDHIYKIHTDAAFKKIPTGVDDVQFLLQPFIHASNFDTGRKNGKADLRVIIGDKQILQSFIRTAKKGDFRANAKQGGAIDYIATDDIPEQVVKMIAQIQKTAHLKNGMYTLDFMRSENGNLYLVEGNASPGLTWSNPEDERRAKQLMRIIVKQLQIMSEVTGPAIL